MDQIDYDSNKIQTDFAYVALHEAAHAVAAEYHASCVDRIELDPADEGTAGYVEANRRLLSPRQRAMAALAGPAQDVRGSNQMEVSPRWAEAAVEMVADGDDDIMREDVIEAKDAIGRDELLDVWEETKSLVEELDKVIEHVAGDLLCNVRHLDVTHLDGVAVREIVNRRVDA